MITMPDTETLTPEQVAEIEARKPFQYDTMVSLTVAQRDALCRSLRAAWADVEDLSQRLIESADRRGEIVTRLAQHEEVNRQLMKDLGRATDECRRLQDERDALRTQNQTQRESVTYFQENEKSLKAQLAQVERERDEARNRERGLTGDMLGGL